MNKKSLIDRKIVLVFAIILLSTSIIPISCGISDNNHEQPSTTQIPYDNQDLIEVTWYNCGIPGDQSQEFDMTYPEMSVLFETITSYTQEHMIDPQSQQSQDLLQQLVTIMQQHGLVSNDIISEIFQRQFTPHFNKRTMKTILPIYENRASASLCNFVTTGTGSQYPIIIFPRLIPIIQLPIPRLFLRWNASDGLTSCGGLRTGEGYIATGSQQGTALGFWGIGFSVFLPPIMQYGFLGYALYATTNAEEIELWPPNNAPVVFNEHPTSGTWDVPVSLSAISFEISDADGEFMSYTVTTEPDIGSGNGHLKPDGFYSIPVSNLEHNTQYHWTIEVNDGKETTIEQFCFGTEALPFDPFEEGWQYRKKITIDHSLVDEDLENFPILLSTIDDDLRIKAQDDGDDIIFMQHPGVSHQLLHELELYDDSTGEIAVWINIDDLPANEDSELYMYYSNPSCGVQQFAERVWDSHFLGVWHMDGLSYTDIVDSTCHHNDATTGSGCTFQQDGKIGYAVKFERNNNAYISIPDNNNLEPSEMTLEIWGNDEQGSCKRILLSKHSATGGDVGGYVFSHWDNDVYWWEAGSDSTWQTHVIQSSQHGETGRWRYHAIRAGSSSSTLIIDDVIDGQDNDVTGIGSTSQPLWMGRDVYHDTRSYDGLLDEIRLSDIARSPGWISTTYNNQNNSSSFTSIGPEEPAP